MRRKWIEIVINIRIGIGIRIRSEMLSYVCASESRGGEWEGVGQRIYLMKAKQADDGNNGNIAKPRALSAQRQ